MSKHRGTSRAIAAAALAVLAAASPVRADSGPVIVIPSRPGVPVVINGRDASYAVVEGDWGLARPGAVGVTVIGGSPVRPNAVYEPRRSYHPRYGRAPERGRQEVEPAADRPLPDPAESYSRTWSSSPDAPISVPVPSRPAAAGAADADIAPATITDPATFVPPLIIGPGDRRRRHHH